MLPRPITFALLYALFTGQVVADQIPGTSVTLEPPPGLAASDRFAGFMDPRTGASINVTDLPAPFREVADGFRLMVVGLSLTEDAPIADRRAFAARRVQQTASVRDIEVGDIEPISIAGLPGLVTIATGVGKDQATPMTIFQVTLFDDAGYVIAVGLTPTARRDQYLPVFEGIARSIAMKQAGG